MSRTRIVVMAFAIVMFVGSHISTAAQSPEANQAITNSPYLSGDAYDLIPEGDPEAVSVVLYKAVDSSNGNDKVIVLVRNNTDKDVIAVHIVGTARKPDGSLFAVSEDERVKPTILVAGGVAVGSLTFLGVDLTDDLDYEFKISEDDHGDLLKEVDPGLEIVSASRIENRIVGEATNAGEEAVDAFTIKGVCFDDGELTAGILDVLPNNTVDPGEVVPFQVELAEPCDEFLITVG